VRRSHLQLVNFAVPSKAAKLVDVLELLGFDQHFCLHAGICLVRERDGVACIDSVERYSSSAVSQG
jgi:hypothetical protein